MAILSKMSNPTSPPENPSQIEPTIGQQFPTPPEA
jgi:hypothetical protein